MLRTAAAGTAPQPRGSVRCQTIQMFPPSTSGQLLHSCLEPGFVRWEALARGSRTGSYFPMEKRNACV